MPGPGKTQDAGRAGCGQDIDRDLAMVVGSSSITRIVVSRIAERAGLRTICHAPDEVPPGEAPHDAGRLPAIAILDGGADGRDCDRLIERLAALRRPAGRTRAPLLILLRNDMDAASLLQAGSVDMVLAKPVTPDRLQPVIRDLMDRLRD